jgi:hypothetical protein
VSKTPEQRAQRLVYTVGVSVESIARAIRAAENAVLERAARTVWAYDASSLGVAKIRSLKSRAPRKAPRRGGAK